MNLEEIERRYAKGYDYTNRENRNQLYNDMEWLMEEVKKNERLKKENQELIYENVKMKNYVKNYGITHGEIKK